MKKKLCLIYNTAPHYREAIFKAIDKVYNCSWWFGKTQNDIKEMDTRLLREVHYYRSYGNPNKLYWQGRMVQALFNKKYDALFILAEVRSLSVWVTIALKWIFRCKKKVYGWSHGWCGREGLLRKKFDVWKGNILDGWFVYNQRSKNLMIEGGMSEDKIHVIANSLDNYNQRLIRERLRPSSVYLDHFGNSNPTLIFIGRLTKSKKINLLLTVINKLKNINLVIVGTGQEYEPLVKLSKDLGIENRVWFYGPSYNDGTNAELLFNADLCVSPGNVGLTAIHSMAFGTPVISHDDYAWQGPEFEAIKAGKTGDFFEKDNVNSLANSISSWLTNNGGKRELIRQYCYDEIDGKWNPDYQMGVIKKNLLF